MYGRFTTAYKAQIISNHHKAIQQCYGTKIQSSSERLGQWPFDAYVLGFLGIYYLASVIGSGVCRRWVTADLVRARLRRWLLL